MIDRLIYLEILDSDLLCLPEPPAEARQVDHEIDLQIDHQITTSHISIDR